MLREADYWTLRRIRMIADYQFFANAGSYLFPRMVNVSISPRTGKVKEIRDGAAHIATLNPRSGMLSLSIEGASRLMANQHSPCVRVGDEFALPVSKGGNVFAKHVLEAENRIRPGTEAIIVSGKSSVIAVGSAILSGEEITKFKYGAAVKVRRGADS